MLMGSIQSKPGKSYQGNQMTQLHRSNCRARGSAKYIILLLLAITVASGVAWYASQNGGNLVGSAESNEVDPNVVQYYERTKSAVEEMRRLQALREVGGNFKEHKDALVALKTAYKGSGIEDIDSREPWVKSADENLISISAFNSNLATVIMKFDTALAAWDDAINATSAVSRVEAERERDINFRAGDKYLDEALDCYADIERHIHPTASD